MIQSGTMYKSPQLMRFAGFCLQHFNITIILLATKKSVAKQERSWQFFKGFSYKLLVGGNISQAGSFPQIGVNIKNMWNHHPD